MPRFLEGLARQCPPQEDFLSPRFLEGWCLTTLQGALSLPPREMPSAPTLTAVPVHGEILHQGLFIQNWML